MLGELCTQLQTLGISVTPTSENTTIRGFSMSAIEPLLKTQITYSITILADMLIINTIEEKAVLERLTGLGLNIASLPCESLQ